MKINDALWEVFKATGHIGVYLLYKDYRFSRDHKEDGFTESCCTCLKQVQAE